MGLTAARGAPYRTIKSLTLPLAASTKAYQGARIYADTGNKCVTIGQGGNANLQPIGFAAQTVDNSAGGTTVPLQVDLDKEITVVWQDTVTGANAVTQANSLFNDVYAFDDHTVTTSSSGSASKAGRVWAVDAIKGVALQAYWIY